MYFGVKSHKEKRKSTADYYKQLYKPVSLIKPQHYDFYGTDIAPQPFQIITNKFKPEYVKLNQEQEQEIKNRILAQDILTARKRRQQLREEEISPPPLIPNRDNIDYVIPGGKKSYKSKKNKRKMKRYTRKSK